MKSGCSTPNARFGKASATLRELRGNPALRAFVFKALLVEVIVPFLLYSAIGLTITAFGGHFNWRRSWDEVAFGVADFRIPLSRMWVQRTKSSAKILLERAIE